MSHLGAPQTDVVVVGGGIVGAACAYFLTASGLRVRLIERDFPASGTSRACDGLLLHHDKGSAAELALARASNALWEELSRSLDAGIEYRRQGALVLAESAEALAAAQVRALELDREGVRSETLAGGALREFEPALAPDLAGAIYYPGEAQLDARLATRALLEAAQRRGATVDAGLAATGLRLGAGGRVAAVVTAAGEIAAEAVVCAAGVWSAELTRSVGVDLPVRPRKGEILVTSRVPGLLRHPLLESSYTASVQSAAAATGVALVAEMTAGDTLLLGSTRQFAGFDRSVSTAALHAIAARAVRFLPALARASVMRSYAGLRPWSPDHMPLVGPVAAVPGLFVATGHEGAGICLAPVTGQIIAGWIAGGRAPALAELVRPERFAGERTSGEATLGEGTSPLPRKGRF
jgi:glycine/D-amino acid oxidase-like deaminating enzyme